MKMPGRKPGTSGAIRAESGQVVSQLNSSRQQLSDDDPSGHEKRHGLLIRRSRVRNPPGSLSGTTTYEIRRQISPLAAGNFAESFLRKVGACVLRAEHGAWA